MEPINPQQDYFVSELQKLLNPLPQAFVDAGLRFEGTKATSESLGNNIEFDFLNEESGITLEVNLGVTTTGCVLSVFISAKESRDQWFSLTDYLTHKGRKQEYADHFPKKGQDPVQYMKNYMEWLCSLVAGEFRPILLGEKWEKIPFDWSSAGR